MLIQDNTIENVVWEMVSIVSRSQSVNEYDISEEVLFGSPSAAHDVIQFAPSSIF